MVTCLRPNCTRKARPGKDQGLCHQHYRIAVRGYLDPAPALERLALLRSRGVTLKMLERHGLTKFCVLKMGDRRHIQAKTAAKIFSVPIPGELVPTLAVVDAVGTRRRLQALCALGYPQKLLGKLIGMPQRQLSAFNYQDRVAAVTALRVAQVYERLHMTPGPSDLCRQYARRRNWIPPLAWDDIDDPDEQPDLVEVKTSAAERIRELHDDLGVRDVNQIARRLRIKRESVERQMYRDAS